MINLNYIIVGIVWATYVLFGFYKLFEIESFHSSWSMFKITIYTIPFVMLIYFVIMFNEDSIQKFLGFKNDKIKTKSGFLLENFWGSVFIFFFMILFLENTYIHFVFGVCDNPKEKIIMGKITKKEIIKIKGDYYLHYINQNENDNNISVSKKVYDKFNIGDKIKFKVYINCFGVMYYYPKKIKYERFPAIKKKFDKNEAYRRQTLLDNAINNKNYEFIKYLILHNAKRSCEILKTKCEPLSPEIEKILKNDKK